MIGGAGTCANGTCANGDYEVKHQNYTWPSEDVYVGELKEDKMDGHEKKTFANRDVYEGEWKENKAEV